MRFPGPLWLSLSPLLKDHRSPNAQVVDGLAPPPFGAPTLRAATFSGFGPPYHLAPHPLAPPLRPSRSQPLRDPSPFPGSRRRLGNIWKSSDSQGARKKALASPPGLFFWAPRVPAGLKEAPRVPRKSPGKFEGPRRSPRGPEKAQPGPERFGSVLLDSLGSGRPGVSVPSRASPESLCNPRLSASCNLGGVRVSVQPGTLQAQSALPQHKDMPKPAPTHCPSNHRAGGKTKNCTCYQRATTQATRSRTPRVILSNIFKSTRPNPSESGCRSATPSTRVGHSMLAPRAVQEPAPGRAEGKERDLLHALESPHVHDVQQQFTSGVRVVVFDVDLGRETHQVRVWTLDPAE